MKALVLEAQWNPRPDYALSEMEKQTSRVINGSAVWRHPQIRVDQLELPRVEADQVLIQVHAVGVCGSDLHMCETDGDGYMLYPGLTRFPCVLGHEFSGRVAEVGRNVTELKPDDLVCVEDVIPCGRCLPCRSDLPNECENLDEIGFSVNGGLAEYATVPARNCWKIDSILERYQGDCQSACEAASTVEVAAVCYNAIFHCAGGFKPGSFAAVYGAGPVGLLAIALLKAGGAARVIAFEPSEKRRELARRMGAEEAFHPAQVCPHEVVMERTGGWGADVQIEAAGAPGQTIPEMEKSLAIDSKIINIGRSGEPTPIYLERLQEKRARIFSVHGNSGYGNFPFVIRLLAAGAFDPLQMITSRFELGDAVEAIRRLKERQEGKVVIQPNGFSQARIEMEQVTTETI